MVIPFPSQWSRGAELHRYLVCDVFTAEPTQGNQLAVFLDGRNLTDVQMQAVAREMNLAETVFLLPPAGDGDVAVRIFTPGSELPFAGHPVLGTAFVVGQGLGRSEVTLETRAGAIPIRLESEDGVITFGRMLQPIPEWWSFPDDRVVLEALGLARAELPVEAYRNGPTHVMVMADRVEVVAGLEPDMTALKRLGTAVSCFSGRGSSWKTRMFFPGGGIPEDAATGSAAGPLAVHLARHGRIPFGQEIVIRQGEEIGRPSTLHATAFGTGDSIDRVEVGGRAVIVAEGSLRVRI